MSAPPDTDGRRTRHVLLFLGAALLGTPIVLALGLLFLPPVPALLLGAAIYGAAHLVSRWRWQLGLAALAVLAYYAYRNGDRR